MHECPECYEACYCGGDIDDIDVGDDAWMSCDHCYGKDEAEFGDEGDDWYDEIRSDVA